MPRSAAAKPSDPSAPPAPGAPSHAGIYESVVAAVSDGRLPPGTKLSEEKLARAFRVSRTRIREVLFRLDQERIVNLFPNRGAFVAKPSADETAELFVARETIETAVAKILSRGIAPSAAKTLRQHARRESSARRAADHVSLARLTGEFHVLLARIAGNRFFVEEMRRLVALTRVVIHLYSRPDADACAEADHGPIVDAIVAGDERLALRLTAEHLTHVRSGLGFDRIERAPPDFVSIFAPPKG